MKKRTATLQVSIASARLKFGIQGTRMKSRTDLRTTRSQPLPSAPARIRAPQCNSTGRASFRLRKAVAISGTAATETKPHTLDGKSPQAIPGFVVSWIDSSPGMRTVVEYRGSR